MDTKQIYHDFLSDPEYIELLAKRDFQALYKKLKFLKINNVALATVTSLFTQDCLNMGIDPAEYFTVNPAENKAAILPAYYLFNANIQSYKVPDNIFQIGHSAFLSSTIKNIDLNSVTEIYSNAFNSCKNLKYIKLPEAVQYLGKNIFYGSGLENLVVESNMILPKYCFQVLNNLTEVTIDGPVQLSEGCFCICNNLTKVNISTKLRKIDLNAFRSSSPNTQLTINYSGTTKEFSRLIIDPDAFNNRVVTIYCTDDIIKRK